MSTRLSVRRALASLGRSGRGSGEPPSPSLAPPLVLVGLSGGADSLALAAALAAEAASARFRAGAIVVDHALQEGSAEVTARAVAAARRLGLEPVVVRRVTVRGQGRGSRGPRSGGPEAAAREARYAAFAEVAAETGASAILTAHTRDDQAEQVLLALARGSGTRSIAGIPPVRGLAPGAVVLRPFLGGDPDVTRAVTEAACAELGLDPWRDPHNSDPSYARVRARVELLPALERALGPGVAAGLARSADLAREDAEALDAWTDAVVDAAADAAGRRIFAPEAEGRRGNPPLGEDEAGRWWIPVAALAELPAAVRQRAIHRIARRGFGASLSRDQTLAIAALVADWHGQGPIHVPGIVVTRTDGALRFERQPGSARA